MSTGPDQNVDRLVSPRARSRYFTATVEVPVPPCPACGAKQKKLMADVTIDLSEPRPPMQN
jgi:hypothetical protein